MVFIKITDSASVIFQLNMRKRYILQKLVKLEVVKLILELGFSDFLARLWPEIVPKMLFCT